MRVAVNRQTHCGAGICAHAYLRDFCPGGHLFLLKSALNPIRQYRGHTRGASTDVPTSVPIYKHLAYLLH
ncbi:uncharacterized protein LY79DRAFT_539572 [Colletotrichum navitas]|uniref:Uncharacterized protein n=1 Tax=Colletotrichum navitas TaxID=681940 RepID=A0AAD8V9F6_9PEZI|nr:uncharacterized protein LY79DRAFT_539572 [Colletotrichum navitas]KAK1597934.1 hypothetical protein LY79DRAFT_539572 [Colletotrichum navitas]